MYPVVIVVNVKAFVRPDVPLAVFAFFWWRPHKAPHRQVIYEQFVPGEEARLDLPAIVTGSYQRDAQDG